MLRVFKEEESKCLLLECIKILGVTHLIITHKWLNKKWSWIRMEISIIKLLNKIQNNIPLL
jgi:hypothetical protein